MMAAVGRPALFVVAVVLCCVCGCAATPAVGDRKQRKEEVALDLKQAKGKVDQTRNALKEAKSKVDAINSATEQFKAAAGKASEAAAALDHKVKAVVNIEQNNIAAVSDLAKTAMNTAKASHESVASIGNEVTKAVDATATARKLLAEAQGLARSTAAEPVEGISTEAKLAQDAFVQLSEMLTALTQTQNSAGEAKKAATTSDDALKASNSAKKAYDYVKDKNPSTPSTLTEDLKKAVEEAVKSAKAAVADAAAASSAATEVSKHAEKAVKTAESQLGQIEAALKELKTPEKDPEDSTEDPQTPSPPPSEPSHDEAQGQSLQQDPLSTTSTGEKPSDEQDAGTTTTDTEKSSSVPSEQKTAAKPMKSNANNPLQGIPSADTSASPSWVRTPLLLVVGVLGLLAVC
ncbi:hypothetical protein DQ04_08421030 [Trypanosoma grayi]|uniref:hypothetical protein n=1 Tax=Trypanosoma grayi TaxID=71804 RepID=UPI0004F46667|nr:hypothetical protein DQ04_08421030 [Trypanosoma grayi]KEG07943.1 hypothetical protein DQ04_08421030 [Trypanosoma grayi]